LYLYTTKAKQGTLLAIQISSKAPNLPKTASISLLLALLSKSATCSRCPSKSGVPDLLLDLDLLGGELLLGDEPLLGDPPLLGDLLDLSLEDPRLGELLLWDPLLGEPLRTGELLFWSRDLLRDLLLTLRSLDLLLDRGLPVRDLVLALESGDPDFERVLGLPDTDFERLRLLPLDGDPSASGFS